MSAKLRSPSGDIVQTLVGDCRRTLPTVPRANAQVCVTSPPYWGQRDYGVCHCGGEPLNPDHGATVKHGLNPARPVVFDPSCPVCAGSGRVPGTDGQIGLESTWQEYVRNIVSAMRAVRRVLRDDGTLWLNLGDSYAGGGSGSPHTGLKAACDKWDPRTRPRERNVYADGKANLAKRRRVPGMNPKQLLGIPRRAILAGSKPGDIVLEPFGGSGTTAQVAMELGRRVIVCELNTNYVPMIGKRTTGQPGLL